jgi:dCMP deaminase
MRKLAYAMRMAIAAATASPDPSRKVGAVAMTAENRIIATGYNGLRPGFDIHPSEESAWWLNDNNRRQFVLHAEENLCSLFRRGEVELVAVTTAPCLTCARLLVAHGVKTVVYGETYATDERGLDYLNDSDVDTIFIPV